MNPIVNRPHLQALQRVRAELAPAMRCALPAVGDEVIATIREQVPEYAKPLEGNFGQGVRAGVGAALTRFVDDIERPDADPGEWQAVYLRLGGGELRQGRTLDSLLGAYRVGARVSWRRLAEAVTEAGASAAELTALAEAIFAYIDELSAISAEGYAGEQAEEAGERQRRRERLIANLADGAGPETIAQAAAQAGWDVPPRSAAVLVRENHAGSLAARLGPGVIAAQIADGLCCAVVPDAEAPGRRRELSAALSNRTAAIGPEVETGALATSVARARLTLDLLDAGVISGRAAFASDHLSRLIVHSDPALLAEHASGELRELGEETPASRERLLETLSAWIDDPGRPTAVAKAIQIHPQTARYRLRRLRELVGDIDDPERRFELALALRAPS